MAKILVTEYDLYVEDEEIMESERNDWLNRPMEPFLGINSYPDDIYDNRRRTPFFPLTEEEEEDRVTMADFQFYHEHLKCFTDIPIRWDGVRTSVKSGLDADIETQTLLFLAAHNC